MKLRAGLHPDHDRNKAIRQRILPEIKKLIVEIRVIAKERGALTLTGGDQNQGQCEQA